MSPLVSREDVGRIAVLTLTHPPANGYSHAMHRELDGHILDVRMDRKIDVIVIRGAGEKFFCAGADLNYLQSLGPEEKYAFCLHANETLLRLENTPKLTIAALNGHCVGGGLEIALACDIRIGRGRGEGAKPDLVGLPEVSLGVLPGTGGTQRLTRLLGRGRAMQMMIEGRNLPVEDAVAIGLVHQVYPEEGWWDAVLAYADGFCRPKKAAMAVGLIKRAVLGGADLPLESGLALERELQQRLFQGPDAREGMAAFTARRAADFRVEPRQALPVDTASAGGPLPERTEEVPATTDISGLIIPDSVLNLLDRQTVEKWMVVPIGLDGQTLRVAMVDPENPVALNVLRELTGRPVEAVKASELDVAVAIGKFYRA